LTPSGPLPRVGPWPRDRERDGPPSLRASARSPRQSRFVICKPFGIAYQSDRERFRCRNRIYVLPRNGSPRIGGNRAGHDPLVKRSIVWQIPIGDRVSAGCAAPRGSRRRGGVPVV
jgi:hypothetical protein